MRTWSVKPQKSFNSLCIYNIPFIDICQVIFQKYFIFFHWEICFRIFLWELVFSHRFSHRQAYGFATIKSISLSLFNNISLSNNNALYFLAIELIRQICAISHIFSNIFQSYMRKWEKKCMKKYYISCKFEYAFDIWEKI